MFANIDWIGTGGLFVGAVGLIYAIWTERRARRRLDITHAFLVGLKPSIEGPRRDEILAAINDQLAKLNK
jgi:hypothetical protein